MTVENFWWGFGLGSIVLVSGMLIRGVYAGIAAILHDPKD